MGSVKSARRFGMPAIHDSVTGAAAIRGQANSPPAGGFASDEVF